MKQYKNKLTAKEGKDLFCKWDGRNYGSTVWLGYVYYKDGKRLEEPYFLTKSDFKEIDHVSEEERKAAAEESKRVQEEAKRKEREERMAELRARIESGSWKREAGK